MGREGLLVEDAREGRRGKGGWGGNMGVEGGGSKAHFRPKATWVRKKKEVTPG